ncbi:MAG TPA: AsnC family transcriptional regulator, partial [Actinomycetota bacterium]|nr:AsnC family transcriptional regulator [Actinomycetota bacterium]
MQEPGAEPPSTPGTSEPGRNRAFSGARARPSGRRAAVSVAESREGEAPGAIEIQNSSTQRRWATPARRSTPSARASTALASTADGSGPTQGLPRPATQTDQGPGDRRRGDRGVAGAHVQRQEPGPAPRQGPGREREPLPGIDPVLQGQAGHGRIGGRHPVGDHLGAQDPLDPTGHRGHGRGERGPEGRIRHRQPAGPATAALGHETDVPPGPVGRPHAHLLTRARERRGRSWGFLPPGPGPGQWAARGFSSIGRSGRRAPPLPLPAIPTPRPYDARMLDARDLEIVAALQEDARATYAEVGRKVGLSPSSVHDRVR